jgi:hypothetical protein
MRKPLLAVCLLTFFFSGYGQAPFFRYKTLRRDSSFSFPVFQGRGGDTVARKINQFLQIMELEMLHGYESRDIFEHITFNPGTIYGGSVGMNCRIWNNSNRVLSVGFDEASSGLTCHYWVRYYNFNPGNGDLVHLGDLFTKAGFEHFRNYVARKRVREFQRQVKADSLLGYIADCYKEDDLSDFYIARNILYVDGQNCFNKNDKFFGIETVTCFHLSEFSAWLNDYGKALFCLTGDAMASYHSIGWPRLYEGRIGKKPVLFALNLINKEDARACYLYLEYGHGIDLEGEIHKSNLRLVEYNAHFDTVGTVSAKLTGNRLSGVWTDKSGRLHYPVSLVGR